MKILNINIFFDEGSTGKLVADLHYRLLRDGHQSYVAYGLGEKRKEKDFLYKITSDYWAGQYGRIARITGLRYCCAYLETYRFLKVIDRIKPDIVHLHCMNCSYINPYILLTHLAKKHYKVLVTNHADVTITANCDHAFECDRWKSGCGHCPDIKASVHSLFFDNTSLSWKMMFKAFSKINKLYVSSVSDWMNERVKQSPFYKRAVFRTIENGIDSTSFCFSKQGEELKKKLKINAPVILHVTPFFDSLNKGGKYVLELARRMPKVAFVIVGVKNQNLNFPSNILPISYVGSKQELASYYSMADLTLLTSKRESFSLVCAESLCCGTPIIGFKAGAPEQIALKSFSEFVDYGDLSELERIAIEWLKKGIDKNMVSEMARQKYDSEVMYQKYLSYYSFILGENQGR